MEFSVSSSGSVDRALRDAERRLVRAGRDSGREIAKVGVKVIRDAARSRRGSLRFGRGKLGVRSRTKGRIGGAVVELYGSPAGAWAIVEDGSKPHAIRPRRARALRFSADEFAASASHPGTTGTGIWTATEAPLDAALVDVIDETVAEALR